MPIRSIGTWLKIDPLPIRFQEMSGGIRVQGSWLDVVSISAKIGGRFRCASSRFSIAWNVYWSGMAEKPKFGPRKPMSSRSQIFS